MKGPSQFDDFDVQHENRPEACLVCEAMCPDAVDGTLTGAEQTAFDKHVASCPHCAQELEEAQRGAAWLSVLKSRAPEPPASLLTRILAETTGAASAHDSMAPTEMEAAPVVMPVLVPALKASPSPAPWSKVVELPQAGLARAPGGDLQKGAGAMPPPPAVGWRGRVLTFRQTTKSFSTGGAAHGLHPRLAMTAAMAFFSVALTLNLTGVRLHDLRASSLRPEALQRSAAEAEATAVRSFQNLRVVYQVESRVSELRQDPLWDDADHRAAAKKPKQPADTEQRGQD